jgi:hypothetical protein
MNTHVHQHLQRLTCLDGNFGMSSLPMYRSKLTISRWTIVWQDSLLSLSFDRSPIAIMTRCELPLSPTALTEGLTYTEAMYYLCQKILVSVNNDTNSQPDFDKIIADSIEVENIRSRVRPELRIKEACKTVQDRLQHCAVILHTSFVVSVLCRPALRRGESPGMNSTQKQILAEKCKENLAETVRMYLKMHSLSVIPTRSWAFTYHGLSSAVLLGILGETKTDPEVRTLQGNLISALSAVATKDQTSPNSPKGDKDIELSGPLSRALVALKNLYDHGWVVERAKGAPTSNGSIDGSLGMEHDPTAFEQQNAAMAMASMQNGIMPPLVYPAPFTLYAASVKLMQGNLTDHHTDWIIHNR